MTGPVIQAESLVKSFGSVRALDGLDLRVAAGQVHGFLGPNGAGKTTTLRIVLGLVRATGGRIAVFGRDPWLDADRVHGDLAYVPGDVALWPGLTGGQCLDALGSTHSRVDVRRRERLVELFQLDPTKRIRDYSKGNRQKVALIAALAADVSLLVLDEPTSGLDPLMEHAFQECVRERREAVATILLSSHILAEVEALADEVSIVRQGRTVTTGTLTQLRRHTRTVVHAVTSREPTALAHLAGVSDLALAAVGGRVDTRLSVDAEHLDAAIGRLHEAHVVSLTVSPPSLDALFLRRYDEPVDQDRGAATPDDVGGVAQR